MSVLLEGIRVIEWGVWHQGPAAAGMIGDLGAEVIKIEERLKGDPMRGLRRIMGLDVILPDGRVAPVECHNRNKRSLTLDLKKEKGRKILYQLVEKSDVFLQNNRPGAAERLGLDYETLFGYNPKLIYVSGSGYGPKGPDSDMPAYDTAAMARSGIMNTVGAPDDPPLPLPLGTTDEMGAIIMAYGILAALLARERLGVGQRVDTSLLGGMIALQRVHVFVTGLLGRDMLRQDRTRVEQPLVNSYRCKDDKWLTLVMMQSDRHWPDLCRALNLAELVKDPRFDSEERRRANSERLISILDEAFATRKREEWLRVFRGGGDLIYGPINTLSDLFHDPQVLENEYIVPFEHPTLGPIQMVGTPIGFSKTPVSIRLPAPELGQHTEEVLRGVLEYSWDEVAQLKEQEVI